MTEPARPTKISFVYSNPADPDAFEAAYSDQIALARKLPGLTRLQTSKVWPKEDGSPTPAYRLLDLYFADYAAASAAAALVAGNLPGRARLGGKEAVVEQRTELVEDARDVGPVHEHAGESREVQLPVVDLSRGSTCL